MTDHGLTPGDLARLNVQCALGINPDEENLLNRVLDDLRTREHLTDDQIAALAPWELEHLDDRYGWMPDDI